MPHIKLEHTEKIEPSIIKPVFKQLIIILIENADVKEENCKCKSILIPEFGSDGDSNYFYHLEISLLKGRSEKIKLKIGHKSLQVLQEYFMDNQGEDLKQFSVEIREMDPSNYFTSNTIPLI